MPTTRLQAATVALIAGAVDGVVADATAGLVTCRQSVDTSCDAKHAIKCQDDTLVLQLCFRLQGGNSVKDAYISCRN